MKRLMIFALAAVLVATLPAVALAGGPEVTRLRYFFVDKPPIPVGEVVEFVDIGEEELVVKWDQRIGAGHVIHYFIFEGVRLSLATYEYENSSSTGFRDPRAGDVAVINYYGDYENGLGEWGEDDGIVDWVSLDRYREWTPQEAALLDLAKQFHREAVEEGFFYLSYAADCPSTEFRVNGVKAQPGPYGQTYAVPPEGGVLGAWYGPGEGPCASDNPDGATRWELAVKPGDAVLGTETAGVMSLADRDPWSLCYSLEWMRPQWQPERLPRELKGYCGIYGRHDTSALATLARLGFMDAGTLYGYDHPTGVTPFVFWGSGRPEGMPEVQWTTVPSITLQTGAVYTASVMFAGWFGGHYPALHLVGGRPGGSDVPWFSWGDPILFVPDDGLTEYSSFDWEKYSVFRVVRLEWLGTTVPTIQKGEE